jgi:uncharacterized protein (DUF58 family)
MSGQLTPVAVAGTGSAVVLFAAGAALGRPDAAVMGIVLLVAVAVAFAHGGREKATVELTEMPRDSAPSLEPGDTEGRRSEGLGDAGATVLRVRAAVRAPGSDIVRVTATALEFDTRAVAVAATSDLVFRIPVAHSGEQELLSVTARAVSADGVWVDDRLSPVRLRVRLEPRARPVPFLPLPSAFGGLTGAHDATRAGEGGEFRDIHPFAPGDRLRRIDWKATARLARRPGDLYVRRTFAMSDVDVALVLDDGDDVSGLVGDWSIGNRRQTTPTSMDVAREAAWSLACGYLAAADQVSFQLFSRTSGAVPRGSGARQRDRLRTAIVGVAPRPRYSRTRTPQVAAGALVVVLSTFLDDEAVRLIALWRAAGHRVVAVDTLPRLRTERIRREQDVAARIILGERADRLHEVRMVGADVFAWDTTPGERRAMLRALTRVRRRG